MSIINKVCVVIPIHSSTPSKNELLSFAQCFKVLHKHPIYVLAPQNLDLSAYQKLVPVFNVKFINPKWQANILNYNKLKLSVFFYTLFKDYEYMLTYELDAFVFKDELLFWCEKGYDYIGAPWFEGYHSATIENKFLGVGNSGFSLRNVAKMDKAIKNVFYDKYGENAGFKKLIHKSFRKLQNLLGENYSIQRDFHHHEDFFIFTEIATKIKDFKIAPINDAIKFSFETNPKQLFDINNQELPFGCHAWLRYEIEFWKEHIDFYNE
jgi:hypothetical protein